MHVTDEISTKGGASSEVAVNSHTNVPCALESTSLQTVTAGKKSVIFIGVISYLCK